jgi:chromosome segregation ATPase
MPMAAYSDAEPTVEIRAKLRARIAKTKSEDARYAALTDALHKARDQQRGIRAKRASAEAALHSARANERGRLAYAFLNDEPEADDPVGVAEAEIATAQAELTRLEEIEAALGGEIESVQVNLRQLHMRTWTDMAELVAASDAYQNLLKTHVECWRSLRTAKAALRLIGTALHNQLPARYSDEWNTAPSGGLKPGDAGLGAGRHFAATGTAMPGIFTLTAPRWLRLVM